MRPILQAWSTVEFPEPTPAANLGYVSRSQNVNIKASTYSFCFTKKHFLNLSHPLLPQSWRCWLRSTCGGSQTGWIKWEVKLWKTSETHPLRQAFGNVIFLNSGESWCLSKMWFKIWLAYQSACPAMMPLIHLQMKFTTTYDQFICGWLGLLVARMIGLAP